MMEDFPALKNQPLSAHTTLGLGGPAEFFVQVENLSELEAVGAWAQAQGIPLRVLGEGSNLVVADSGVEGLVLKVAFSGIGVRRDGDAITLEVGAGVALDQVVALAVQEGWAGVECLSGIPGSVGAAPVQNVGAYGQEIGERILWVEVFHRFRGSFHRLTPRQCRFAYRDSRFRRKSPYIITRVALGLTAGGKPSLRYPELRQLLGSSTKPPGLGEVRDAVLELRRAKGMVLAPGPVTNRSVGSFFKNPLLTPEAFQRLQERVRDRGLLWNREPLPSFPAGEQVKVPAAFLVEKAGFPKGFSCGHVGISPQHALALVHYGGGSTQELLALATAIQKAVQEQFAVLLEPEPAFWGFATTPPLPGAWLQ